MTYYYKIQKEKKLTPTITRMANVTVYNDKGKEIGMATVSKWEQPEKVVDMLIREHEIRKAWNNPNLSFNQKTKTA